MVSGPIANHGRERSSEQGGCGTDRKDRSVTFGSQFPSAPKPLRAASGQIAFGFLEIIADGRIAIAHRRPRDVPGWSRVASRRGGRCNARPIPPLGAFRNPLVLFCEPRAATEHY